MTPADAAADTRRSGPSRLLLGAVIIVTTACDQVTKALVRSVLPLYESIPVIPGVLNFTHVRNTGTAFGLLNTVDLPFKPVLLTGVGLLALAVLAYYAKLAAPRGWTVPLALALVAGGATGNLIDRVRTGYVLDFVDVYWRNWHFWVFNVADSAITVGGVLLVIDMVWGRHHVSDPA